MRYRPLLCLASIFIKEQLKEPVAFIWILLSPAVLFYFLLLSRGDGVNAHLGYMTYASGYYAYVASSVAFFGFSFYLIGRRESGFVRSFVYSKSAKRMLLLSQLTSYSVIALMYCAVLYLVTRPLFGDYRLIEFAHIVLRFMLCFLMFCIGGVFFAMLRLSFQNANTLFSVVSFLMMALMIAGRIRNNELLSMINQVNPMSFAADIMLMPLVPLAITASGVLLLLFVVCLFGVRFMRVNPVWSRY